MEAVGRLAGGVAHDFNNLLVGLLGYTELLLANLDPAHPAQAFAERILTASERTTSLTRQLLAFSRQQVLAPRVMNLNDTIAETDKMLRRLIGEGIELTSELDPTLGIVKADPAQLAQVLLSLAINARDAMPRGGQLRLKTANLELTRALASRHDLVPAGRYAVLTVSDSGAGMDEEVLEHLFEPFFTTKQPGMGTGLGLAIVYGVVKQSGGYVVVESQHNLGTRFTIYLPRIEKAVEEASVGQADAVQALAAAREDSISPTAL
ncbi:MAG: ATP-binding protein, partial [Anaerolineales bacterium]